MSPADLRAMLRADAVNLVLGALLLVAGLLTTILAARWRRRDAPLVWLGIFALVYGLRLLARTPTFRLYFDVAPLAWEYVASALTYTVQVPIAFFARAMTPTWRRLATFIAVGLAAFAICAIASDAILHRPNSATTPNNLIVITLTIVVLIALFRPTLTSSHELRILRIGALSVSATILIDNLRGIGVLRFPSPALEPFGFIVSMACLGTLVARRLLSDARRLVAIDRELSIARQIQSSILPQAMPRIDGLTLVARYRPMAAVAGDFYDFVEIDEQRIGVLIADVSGHGVPAALIASMVKVTLAAQQARADQPAAVLAGMNEALYGRLGGQFVTAAYLFIDGRTGLIRYAAAGHPPMLHLARGHAEVREVEKNGLALGFVPTASYDEVEQRLRVGDRLLLYTDGLIEATNAEEDFFEVERVKRALAAGAALPTDAAADALLDTMHTWSGLPAGDDLTIVLVDWSNPG